MDALPNTSRQFVEHADEVIKNLAADEHGSALDGHLLVARVELAELAAELGTRPKLSVRAELAEAAGDLKELRSGHAALDREFSAFADLLESDFRRRYAATSWLDRLRLRYRRKALLPVAAVAAIVAMAGLLGASLTSVTASQIAGVGAALLVSVFGSFAASRFVGWKRGDDETTFLVAPDATEMNTGIGLGVLGTVGPFSAWVAVGLLAAALLRAAGFDNPAFVEQVGVLEAVGLAAAAPVWPAASARIGLRAERRLKSERESIATAGLAAAAHTPEDGGQTISEPVVVGVARLRVITASALALGSIAWFLTIERDEPWTGVETVAIYASAALIIVACAVSCYLAMRRRWFLRVDGSGIDLFDTGPVPWGAVELIAIGRVDAGKSLLVFFEEDAWPRTQPWFTSRHRKAGKRIKEQGVVGVSAFTFFAKAKPAELAHAVRRAADRDVVPL